VTLIEVWRGRLMGPSGTLEMPLNAGVDDSLRLFMPTKALPLGCSQSALGLL